MTQQITGSENLDMVLGNPSTQKILRLLSIHPQLSVQEIKSLSNISESQIHLTLKNMVESKLVKRSSRGVYELSQSAFTKLLQEAYISNSIELVNDEISNIQDLLKQKEYNHAREKYKILLTVYLPLLKKHFHFIMSGLAHEFMDSRVELAKQGVNKSTKQE